MGLELIRARIALLYWLNSPGAPRGRFRYQCNCLVDTLTCYLTEILKWKSWFIAYPQSTYLKHNLLLIYRISVRIQLTRLLKKRGSHFLNLPYPNHQCSSWFVLCLNCITYHLLGSISPLTNLVLHTIYFKSLLTSFSNFLWTHSSMFSI